MNIYSYQRPLGKIDDTPDLRHDFIAEYDARSKEDMVRFGLLLGDHLLDITGFEPCEEVRHTFANMRRWLDGQANYHESRSIDYGSLWKEARAVGDLVKERFFRTMHQITCIPHCKYHALWATDFAVTMINRMFPGNMDEVRKEREAQLELIRRVNVT
ncbi:MAG: hypothetical protein LBG71_01375 [Clostridiales Family XIII bacterium]|jgi:hypothetical protein|nr:hypothetical protein [Clostridiales Family XIII bacterium]